MKQFARWFVFFGSTAVLPSCVIYKSYDREVRVWNSATNQVAGGDEFRFFHATPVPHFPRNPDPVRVQLDSDGVALVRLPGVLGWAGTSRYGITLIDDRLIRDGGTAELMQDAGKSGRTSAGWKIMIGKPSKNSKKRQAEQADAGNRPTAGA